RVEDAGGIADKLGQEVRLDALGSIAAPAAAQVGRDRVEPGPGERRQLVPPDLSGVREAVQQQHGRPVALLDEVEAEAVCLDVHACAARGAAKPRAASWPRACRPGSSTCSRLWGSQYETLRAVNGFASTPLSRSSSAAGGVGVSSASIVRLKSGSSASSR